MKKRSSGCRYVADVSNMPARDKRHATEWEMLLALFRTRGTGDSHFAQLVGVRCNQDKRHEYISPLFYGIGSIFCQG